jgi:acyl carrier protein
MKGSNTMDRNAIFAKVKEYILQQLPVDEGKIVDSARMIEDLGADSANLMMLIMDLETEFNMTVEDEVLGTIKTVGDIVDYIQKKG